MGAVLRPLGRPCGPRGLLFERDAFHFFDLPYSDTVGAIDAAIFAEQRSQFWTRFSPEPSAPKHNPILAMISRHGRKHSERFYHRTLRFLARIHPIISGWKISATIDVSMLVAEALQAVRQLAPNRPVTAPGKGPNRGPMKAAPHASIFLTEQTAKYASKIAMHASQKIWRRFEDHAGYIEELEAEASNPDDPAEQIEFWKLVEQAEGNPAEDTIKLFVAGN